MIGEEKGYIDLENGGFRGPNKEHFYLTQSAADKNYLTQSAADGIYLK
jgi:hypothetical protein